MLKLGRCWPWKTVSSHLKSVCRSEDSAKILVLDSLRGGRKKGRGRGREKGKREGSACSNSLCFCITPTNFLVIRLCLLSIKCRYTCHCRKTLHSRTKEIRLVIQIQKALWRKLETSFTHNKKSFTLQKRSKKLRLHQRANPADQKTITTVNRYYVMTSQCETCG